VKEVPPEWFDLTKVYDPNVVGSCLQQVKSPTPAEVKPWLSSLELPFKQYRKFMQGQFRALAAADPRAPVDLMVQWADATGGVPASCVLALWLAELLSLAHPRDEPDTLRSRITNALGDRGKIWSGACSVGRELWPNRSVKQIQEKLIALLADHVAAQLWGCRILRLKVWPQTARRKPYAHEGRSQDVRAAWNTMEPKDAVVGAQLERTFGEPARKDPGYNPEHPLAHAVKIESAKPPAQGQKAFLLIITIVPLVLHHSWGLIDMARCLVISRPDLAIQFDISDPAKRDRACRYVKRQLLKPLGLGGLTNDPGRPSGSGGALPPGFGSARLSALALRTQPLT
jgi:hypothetical protein